VEGQLRHTRTGQGTRTRCAKLPEIQGAIPRLWCVMFPVATCGEIKIIASLPPDFPPSLEATV
jgi:hypothetical protein